MHEYEYLIKLEKKFEKENNCLKIIKNLTKTCIKNKHI